MHIHSLKLLTLLSVLSCASVAFPSALPAQQAADSFEAKLAAIDAMADVDILCESLPLSRDEAEQCLVERKASLADNKQQLSNFFDDEVQKYRVSHKYWTACREIEACNNDERKQQLINKKQQFDARVQDINGLLRKETDTLLNEGGNSAFAAYNYRVRQVRAFANQLRLERIKNEEAEKEKARLQQEKLQSQQEIQALKVQNRNLQAFIDGPQREGVPNVPGGPQLQEGIQKKKRSSSCERQSKQL